MREITAYQLQELARIERAIIERDPTAYVLLHEILHQAWCRYVGIWGRGDESARSPEHFLELLRGDLTGDTATIRVFSQWRTLSDIDRMAISDVLDAIPEDGKAAHTAQEGRYNSLTRGLERLTGRYLTQSQLAQLAAHLTRRAAYSVGRAKQALGTDDAASGRLQVIADQWVYLTVEQQQLAAAVIASFANGTPDRTAAVRRAVRDLALSAFATVADLAYLVKACADRMVRLGAPREATDA
jgi:hypothetical protein